jgi:hypothetical protein
MTWWGANAWADQLVYGGFDDWRLPSALNQDGSGPNSGCNITGSEMGHLYYTASSDGLGNSAGGRSATPAPLLTCSPTTTSRSLSTIPMPADLLHPARHQELLHEHRQEDPFSPDRPSLSEIHCVTGHLDFGLEFSQPLEHILPIPIIYEYLSSLDSTDHDVIQNTW